LHQIARIRGAHKAHPSLSAVCCSVDEHTWLRISHQSTQRHQGIKSGAYGRTAGSTTEHMCKVGGWQGREVAGGVEGTSHFDRSGLWGTKHRECSDTHED
jgi:hypothetical protein